ncbi:MAG: CBS domain-containing protein [Promethearchaeota archaeon]|jgi:CBS domain-containing protein
MSGLEDFVISEKATLLQASEKIDRNHSRAVVVRSGEKVVGIISEGDILRALLKGADIHAPIAPFMVYSFKYLSEKDIIKAYKLVKKYLFTLVPVIDENFHLMEVITLADILDSLNCMVKQGHEYRK